MKLENMKLTDAKVFYRTLSLICFFLSTTLLIRRIILLDLEIINIFFGFLWPIVGFIVAILFLKKDGYTTSASEIMFFLFILYCSVYFIFPSILILLEPQLELNIIPVILNFIIIALGCSGIAYYIIY